MTAMADPPIDPPIEPRRPGYCSLMDGPEKRCLQPARFYPCGWRCERHVPNAQGGRS